jgi:hypothetical protein
MVNHSSLGRKHEHHGRRKASNCIVGAASHGRCVQCLRRNSEIVCRCRKRSFHTAHNRIPQNFGSVSALTPLDRLLPALYGQLRG